MIKTKFNTRSITDKTSESTCIGGIRTGISKFVAQGNKLREYAAECEAKRPLTNYHRYTSHEFTNGTMNYSKSNKLEIRNSHWLPYSCGLYRNSDPGETWKPNDNCKRKGCAEIFASDQPTKQFQKLFTADFVHLCSYPGILFRVDEVNDMKFSCTTGVHTNLVDEHNNQLMILGIPSYAGAIVNDIKNSGQRANATLLNCEEQKRFHQGKWQLSDSYVSLALLGDVKPNEEILIDYGEEYWTSHDDFLGEYCSICYGNDSFNGNLLVGCDTMECGTFVHQQCCCPIMDYVPDMYSCPQCQHKPIKPIHRSGLIRTVSRLTQLTR